MFKFALRFFIPFYSKGRLKDRVGGKLSDLRLYVCVCFMQGLQIPDLHVRSHRQTSKNCKSLF